MSTETPAPPPEARLIRTARDAAGLSAEAAAKSTGGAVSAAYWRDVERGHGWRRGERVKVTGSARVIAHMARAVGGLTPERLESEGERADAAVILREILRTSPGQPEPAARHLAAVPDPGPLPDDPMDWQVEQFIGGQENPYLQRILRGIWESEPIPRAIRLESIRALAEAEAARGRQPGKRSEPGA